MDDQNTLDERDGQPTRPARRVSRSVSLPTMLGIIFMTLWFLSYMVYFIAWMVNETFSPSTRSPVARVRGDQRTITIALETYYLDYHNYPAWSAAPAHNAFGDLARRDSTLATLPTFTMAHGSTLQTLTTPVSYITTYFADPFAPVKGATFGYWHDGTAATTATGYILWSPGPDKKYDLTSANIAEAYTPATNVPSALLTSLTYDPSNGTPSGGDVYRVKQ